MTIALTAAIAIPNVGKLKVGRVHSFDEDAGTIEVTVEAFSASRSYGAYSLLLMDGDGTSTRFSRRMKLNAASETYGDAIVLETVNLVGAYTAVRDAFLNTVGNMAARRRAVETALLAVGGIDASLAGAVS
tara:strand:+ start:426 stop:818 length:393 start_codon:yes stop_codon:yes gene_type:complete